MKVSMFLFYLSCLLTFQREMYCQDSGIVTGTVVSVTESETETITEAMSFDRTLNSYSFSNGESSPDDWDDICSLSPLYVSVVVNTASIFSKEPATTTAMTTTTPTQQTSASALVTPRGLRDLTITLSIVASSTNYEFTIQTVHLSHVFNSMRKTNTHIPSAGIVESVQIWQDPCVGSSTYHVPNTVFHTLKNYIHVFANALSTYACSGDFPITHGVFRITTLAGPQKSLMIQSSEATVYNNLCRFMYDFIRFDVLKWIHHAELVEKQT